MEINILLALKWLFGGAALLCFGWLSEERKSLKKRVQILEEKVSDVERSLGVISTETHDLIDAKLNPIKLNIESVMLSMQMISHDIKSLIGRLDKQTSKDNPCSEKEE